jgi:hypothetical protein
MMGIGGLTKKSPWRRQVALSEEISPSEEEPPVMAVRSGENRWLLEIDRWLRQQS